MDSGDSGPDSGGFREHAVQQRQSGERFDSPLVLVGIRGWLSLSAVALLLAAAVWWLLTASVPLMANGQGILLPCGGMTAVAAPRDGMITRIRVQEGDVLEPGDCLALIGGAGDDTAPCSVLCSSRASVQAVEVSQGDSVQTGDLLFSLEPAPGAGQVLQAVMYFPPEEGQDIRTGMNAGLDPASTELEDTGYLMGCVASVSAFPVTEAEIAARTGNGDLAREWTHDGPVIEVLVSLIPDSGTVSGYRWTSRRGASVAIHAGCLCAGEITLAQRRPIDLLLPEVVGKSRSGRL